MLFLWRNRKRCPYCAAILIHVGEVWPDNDAGDRVFFWIDGLGWGEVVVLS